MRSLNARRGEQKVVVRNNPTTSTQYAEGTGHIIHFEGTKTLPDN